jgi:oxygen-independent coproporphyrinogen-3 oxidase
VTRDYLDHLSRELALLAARLPRRPSLRQMHWGGGTPTYLAVAELETLFAAVTAHWTIEPRAELAIEIDPRVTSVEQLEALARLGFNRLSMGVQDFTPEVQEAIGRRQTFAETKALMEAARALGFSEGINFDLIYGLPRQTAASFELSLERLVELRPDRVAMYSFAFVPWARLHQRRLDAAALPERGEKLALHLMARARLLGAGYVQVGIDHFALPSDELARAAGDARLARNFMGYTVKESSTLVAAGVSGIGEVAGAFFQNQRKLSSYYAAIDAGRLPIERGYVLDPDDRIRQFVIRELLCNFAVDRNAVRRELWRRLRRLLRNRRAEIASSRRRAASACWTRRVRVSCSPRPEGSSRATSAWPSIGI